MSLIQLSAVERKRQLSTALSATRAQETGAIAFVVMAENEMIDDVTITENYDLFVEWDENFTTNVRGAIVKEFVNGEWKLFRSIHPIFSSAQNIRPSTDKTGQLWTPIGNIFSEYPDWVRPLGTHDAYMAGAKVSHNGKKWGNTHGDYNTWEPGVYGWVEHI